MVDEKDLTTKDLRELEEELQSPEMKAAEQEQAHKLQQFLAKGVREHRRILALSRERASRQVRW